MSKFEYGQFYNGYDEFAVNAEKYTKKQAIEIFKREKREVGYEPIIGNGKGEWQISKAWTKWRAGINEDGEPCVGYWLEYRKRPKGSCPAWVFHKCNGSVFEKHIKKLEEENASNNRLCTNQRL